MARKGRGSRRHRGPTRSRYVDVTTRCNDPDCPGCFPDGPPSDDFLDVPPPGFVFRCETCDEPPAPPTQVAFLYQPADPDYVALLLLCYDCADDAARDPTLHIIGWTRFGKLDGEARNAHWRRHYADRGDLD